MCALSCTLIPTVYYDALLHLQPGHLGPRFSVIHWALCVPASCNASDVQVALSDTLQRHTEGTGFDFQVRVTDDVSDRGWQTPSAKLYHHCWVRSVSCCSNKMVVVSLFTCHVSCSRRSMTKQIVLERKQGKQQKQEEGWCLERGNILCVRQEVRASGK